MNQCRIDFANQIISPLLHKAFLTGKLLKTNYCNNKITITDVLSFKKRHENVLPGVMTIKLRSHW